MSSSKLQSGYTAHISRMMHSSVLLFSSACLLFTSSILAKDVSVYPLPSYVTRTCKMNDPQFNKCFKDVANSIIKTIAKGDPAYNVPQLDPLSIKEMKIKQGNKQIGLEMACKDCYLRGLRNTTFTKVNMDFKKLEHRWDMYVDRLVLTGKYKVDGKVLLLPITGQGDAELIFEKNVFSLLLMTKYEKKNNFTYITVTNSNFTLEPESLRIRLNNLFNGDKLLGDNMNEFLNEHWKEIHKDLGPTLGKTFGRVFSDVINNISKLVPKERMFPDD